MSDDEKKGGQSEEKATYILLSCGNGNKTQLFSNTDGNYRLRISYVAGELKANLSPYKFRIRGDRDNENEMLSACIPTGPSVEKGKAQECTVAV